MLRLIDAVAACAAVEWSMLLLLLPLNGRYVYTAATVDDVDWSMLVLLLPPQPLLNAA